MSYLPTGYMSLMSYAPMSQVIIELNLYRAYLVPSKTKRFLFIISHKYDTTSHNICILISYFKYLIYKAEYSL